MSPVSVHWGAHERERFGELPVKGSPIGEADGHCIAFQRKHSAVIERDKMRSENEQSAAGVSMLIGSVFERCGLDFSRCSRRCDRRAQDHDDERLFC